MLLLSRCWPGVVRVAQGWQSTGEMTQADVVAALDVTDGGGPGSTQLGQPARGCATCRPASPPDPNTRSCVLAMSYDSQSQANTQ